MSHHYRSTRAWRRHDIARLKSVRANHLSMRWRAFSLDDPKAYDVCLGRLVTTAAPCSCWMCGNPRRSFKDRLTLAEKKARDSHRAGLADWQED